MLQFALPVVGALAEAASGPSVASAAASGHVEDRSGPGCRPVHPPDCARCQGLWTHAVASATPAVDWTRIAAAGSPPSDDAGPRDAASWALPLSRAPPLFS
ncbi:MAG: hypothetical protein M3282_02115 [Gemmatimonadota bacterium]|nr:hypothetical protein [Gemmatimonadota bacterium]